MNSCRALLPAVAAGVGALLLAGSAGAASLIGQQGAGAYYTPDTGTVYPQQTDVPASFTIGAGEEQVVTIEGVTAFHVDFDADTLSVLFETSLTNPTLNNQPFNGLIFNSAGFTTLASATVNPGTTLGSFDNSRVTLTGDELRLNFSGLSYHTGDLVRLDFTSQNGGGAVPEPATWATMILGFAAIGGIIRRRRTLETQALA